MKGSMIAHLTETGEWEKLKALLRKRLTESGWRDEMKAECKEIIKQRGVNNVSVEDLVKEITPKAREKVGSEVKLELLQNIRTVLNTSNDVL